MRSIDYSNKSERQYMKCIDRYPFHGTSNLLDLKHPVQNHVADNRENQALLVGICLSIG